MARLLAFILLAAIGVNLPAQAPPAAHGRGYKQAPPAVVAARHAAAFARHNHRMKALAATVTPPAKFDCVDMGWVPPIRDQGNCGSCWDVSAADAITCCFIKAGYGKADDTFKISDQYGMDCQSWGGCNGGDEADVIDWCKKTGLPAERYIDATGSHSDYGPYTASEGRCQLKQGAKLWQIADYGYATGDQSNRPATVDEIKTAIIHFGVLSFALDASSFNNYNGGVITSLGSSIDHAITMTGWDDAKQAFHVRNQWSKDWGENGYGWISYTASRQLTEIIWVTVTVLPPPPPIPPDPPPAPPPSGPVTVTLTPAQVASVLQQAGVTDNEILLRKKLAEIQAVLDSIKARTTPVGMAIKPVTAALPTTAEPPLAVDEFASALKTAWSQETNPKREEYRKTLSALYTDSSILLDYGSPASDTVQEFYQAMHAAGRAKMLPDSALPRVRAALDADPKRIRFADSQPLDASAKTALANELKRHSDYLERMAK